MTIKELQEIPEVRYIYKIPYNTLCGASIEDEYVIITDPSIVVIDPPEYTQIFTMPEWFEKVANCEILPWICACLNKKYVIKEYVKLLMTTDLLKLRIKIDEQIASLNPESEDKIRDFTLLFLNAIFATQICENHKIVNFKQGNTILMGMPKTFDDCMLYFDEKIYIHLKQFTDGVYNKNKMLQKKKIKNQLIEK